MGRRALGISGSGDSLVVVEVRRFMGRMKTRNIDPKTARILLAESGATVVAGMSPSATIMTWVQAPFRSARKARRVAATLLDVELPFSLDQCQWTIITERPAGKSQQAEAPGYQMLAVAARESDVVRRLEELRESGIDPHILDHEGIALWDQALREVPGRGGVRRRGVVYGSSEGVIIAAGNLDSAPRISMFPALDPKRMEGFLTAQFGLDWRASGPPDQLGFVIGGPMFESGGEQAVREALKLPDTMPVVIVSNPSVWLAKALATRAVTHGPYRCNLRSGSLTHPQILRRLRRTLLVHSLIVAGCGMLLAGAGWGVRWSLQARVTHLNREFQNTADRLAGYELVLRGSDAVNEVSQVVARRMDEARLFEQQMQPSLLTGVQAAMHVVSVSAGKIEQIETGNGDISLTVSMPDKEALAECYKGLVSEGYSVQQGEAPQQAPDGTVRTTIRFGGWAR